MGRPAIPLTLIAPIGLLLAVGCGGGARDDAAGALAIFGRTGVGPAEFNYPRAAAVAADGTLFVVDKGGRIQHLTDVGSFISDWELLGHTAGKPTGMGLAPDGRLFVADTHYAQVLVFDADGSQVAQFGSSGDALGQFRMPTDVAIDADGIVYVGEYGGNDRITRFSRDLEPLGAFDGTESGGPRLARPQALVFDAEQRLWVCDAGNHRVCCFSRTGELLRSWGRLGSGPGELRFPYGLAILHDGSVVVCEYGNNRLQRFTAEGAGLGTWGRPGRQPGELAYPWSVVADRVDRLYVIDSGNNRVQVVAGADERTWQAVGSGNRSLTPG